MDYQKIVLQGYLNDNNRGYLEKYFIREFKKAETEFFEADEFFNGCLNVVKELEAHIKHLLNDRRNKLESQLNHAKNGLTQYKYMEGKTSEQKRQETVEFCKTELASLREGDFPIPLRQLTNNRAGGNIYKKDLLQIELAINKAFQESAKNDHNRNSEQEILLSDFFDLNKINVSKITKIQKAFKNFNGKSAGVVIYLLKDKYQLIEIIPNDSHGKNFKNFYKLFGFDGASEGARKYVSNNHWFDEKKNEQLQDKTLSSIEKRLNEILK